MTEYWGGGGKIHFFLLTLYNFKNIGGEGTCPPCPPPPYSAVPVKLVVFGVTSESLRLEQQGLTTED